jgi:Flp pilus assembly pilin Flp
MVSSQIVVLLSFVRVTGREGKVHIIPDKEGQSLTEYALLLLFLAIVVIIIVLVLGEAIGNLYQVIVYHMWPN